MQSGILPPRSAPEVRVPVTHSRRPDTTTAGLMRLYYRIVLTVVAAVLLLQVLTRLVFGSGEEVTPPRIALYGSILLFSWFGHELVRHGDDPRRREPRGILLGLLGFLQVILCIETGGLASAYYMLLVATCVFGALVMRPHKAILLTSFVAAAYCLATWIYPSKGGLIDGSFGDVLSALRSGRSASAREMSALVIHSGFLFVGAWIAVRLSWGFRERVETLETTATRDPLTDLPNRRGFVEKIQGEIQRATEIDWPMGILIADLDLFRDVNTKYGHPVGDKVLRAAARLLRETAGPLDHVGRIGGEEFAVAAVGAERRAGADLADRIVRAFRAYDWGSVQPGLKLTISVGVDVVHPGRQPGPIHDLDTLLRSADEALYYVKSHGRNGFLVAGDAVPPAGAVRGGPGPRNEPPGSSGPGVPVLRSAPRPPGGQGPGPEGRPPSLAASPVA